MSSSLNKLVWHMFCAGLASMRNGPALSLPLYQFNQNPTDLGGRLA
jgi:hypothetical protein